VMIQDLDKSLAESFGLDRPRGALVSQVTADGPAQDSGIKAGDIILEYDGKPVDSSSDLPPLVGSTTPGDTVEVELVRAGEAVLLDVTIRELQQDKVLHKTSATKVKPDTVLGMRTRALKEEEREALDLENGVRAEAIERDGVAAGAGIQAGDIIVSVNQVDIRSPQQLAEVVSELEPENSVPVLVLRNNTPHFVALAVPKA
ncbi:MAG: PDZ domain-containing protein, partial [Pseudomonadota bacterium]